jgi:hypothetical protein
LYGSYNIADIPFYSQRISFSFRPAWSGVVLGAGRRVPEPVVKCGPVFLVWTLGTTHAPTAISGKKEVTGGYAIQLFGQGTCAVVRAMV